MARTLNAITLANPLSDPNIVVDGTFAFDGTPGFSGNGAVNTYSFQWQYNKNGAGWVACGTGGTTGIIVTSNPYVGTSPNTNLNTATGKEADTYSVRIVGDPAGGTSYSIISNTQTVTVSTAGTTYTQTVNDTLDVADALSNFRRVSRLSSDVLLTADEAAQYTRRFRLTSDQFDLLDNLISSVIGGSGTIYTETLDSLIAAVIDGGWRKTSTIDMADSLDSADEASSLRWLVRQTSDTILTADQAFQYVRRFRLSDDQLDLIDNLVSQVISAGGTIYSETLDSLIAAVTDSGKIAETVHTVSMGDQGLIPTDGGWSVREWVVMVDDIPVNLWDEETHSVGGGGGPTVYTQTAQSLIADVTDQVTHYRRLNRAVASTITVTDPALAQALRNRLTSDPLALVDGLLSSLARTRVASDAISLGDGSSYWTLRSRLAQDVLDVVDAYTKVLVGLVIYFETATDTLAVADATGRVVFRTRTVDDAVALADQLTAAALHNRIAGDAISLTDALVRYVWHNRSQDDALAVIDGITYDWISSGAYYVRTSTDTLEVLDDHFRVLWAVKVVGDALTVDEAVVASASRSRRSDEALTVIDALLAGTVRNRMVADTLGVADYASLSIIRNRLLADLLGVTDQAIASRILNRAVSDALALADDLIKGIFGGAVLTLFSTDGLTVTDSIVRRVWLRRTLGDAVSTSDHAAKVVSQLRGDGVGVSDGVAYSKTFGRVGSDVISVDDGIMRFLHRLAVLSDSLVVADGVLTARLYTRQVADLFDITDAIGYTFVSGLEGLIDIRIMLGASKDADVRLGVHQLIWVGTQQPRITLGAYN